MGPELLVLVRELAQLVSLLVLQRPVRLLLLLLLLLVVGELELEGSGRTGAQQVNGGQLMLGVGLVLTLILTLRVGLALAVVVALQRLTTAQLVVVVVLVAVDIVIDSLAHERAGSGQGRLAVGALELVQLELVEVRGREVLLAVGVSHGERGAGHHAAHQVARVRERARLVLVGAGDAAHDLHPFGPVALVHGAEFVAAAAHAIGSDRFELHADVKTLLEATVWTPLSLRLIYVTASVGHTRVDLLVLHCSLEEAIAALAGQQTIVVAAGCDIGVSP